MSSFYLNVLADTFKKDRGTLILYLGSSAITFAVYALYSVALEPFLYVLFLETLLMTVIFAVDYLREIKKAGEATEIAGAFSANSFSQPPIPQSTTEKAYRRIIDKLRSEIERINASSTEEKEGILDYFTAWVHQIKTPIAVIKLKLGENESDLLLELFRIEQYTDMALQFVRSGSPSTDLVIKEYRLDEIIRASVRKFAPQFIYKKLKLEYEPVDTTVITDKKWIGCILDQLLSNAIKYTDEGQIKITFEGDRLVVSDTGIGIAAEDLPRIFEKGFTGTNGRSEKRSTGLGLYLCRKAANILSVRLEAKSTPGKGSAFCVIFSGESII